MDIYFEEAYGKLYETAQHGTLERFEYENDHGKIIHQFIKRPVDIDLGDEKKYYDLITPYGYGGPVILNCSDGEEKRLVDAFSQAFAEYCIQNNIVSEYITFHPLVNNALDFMDMYHPEFTRKTLGPSLQHEDPIQSEFAKRCRTLVRKMLREGVSYRITYAPDGLDQFLEIYYDTMDRNHAKDFYYFDRSYFQQMLDTLKNRIVLVEAIYEDQVIASELELLSEPGGAIHAHLAGTKKEFLHLSPQYVINYALTIWGKENGYSVIHSGGGLSAAEDDVLLQFKRKFSQKTEFDLYTAKKIWDPVIYNKICDSLNMDCSKVSYFPAYRSVL